MDKQKIMTRLTPFGVHLEPPLSMQQHGGSAWLRGGERVRKREEHAQFGLSLGTDGLMIITATVFYATNLNIHHHPAVRNRN